MTPPLRRLLLTALVLAVVGTALPVAAATPPAARADEDLARYVDPMIGTAPVGFVFPGAVRPFGMVQVSPDTEGPFAYSGYIATDATIRGFSMVHLSGPGVPKGGDLPFMPTVGPVVSGSAFAYASPFDRATESAAPGDYRVVLAKSGTQVELTAGQRVGLQRYTFPPSPQSNVLIDVSRSAEQNQSGSPFGVREGHVEVTAPNEVSGWTKGRYPVHFVARFDRPFTTHGTWREAQTTPGSAAATGRGVGGWVSFDTTANRVVTMEVGISFVDVEGARRNLDAEGGVAFDDVREQARAAWNAQLNRIRVTGGTELDRTSFYTALYHASLHPNVFSDADGRYRGMDDAIHTAAGRTHYANFASWDTYKAHNQLTATLTPDRYREMVLSQLDNYRTLGRIPRFGEHSIDAGHMSGDPAIPMIVDGFCRGVLDDVPAADLAELYRGMTELATTRRPPELRDLGYLPDRPGTTLEYGGADFALALMADELGLDGDAQRWLAQSLSYRNVLDPETGWVRPRAADGSWKTPFEPTDEDGFQEGNSWQYSWLAPHDARGVFDRMAGEAAQGDAVATQRLDDLFDHDLAALAPAGVAEVHNRLNVFGLVYRTATYAPGNEHDLQVPWLYPFAGQPWKTQAVHRQIQSLFRATPDGLPGNDDLGGLSAWHVFSALGFGPSTPGAPFYVVGAPQFTGAQIALPGGRSFTLEAPGASLTGKYVQSASIDGRPLEQAWFAHDVIAAGRTLRLEMGTAPNTTWAVDAPPPSASDTPLAGFGCRGA